MPSIIRLKVFSNSEVLFKINFPRITSKTIDFFFKTRGSYIRSLSISLLCSMFPSIAYMFLVPLEERVSPHPRNLLHETRIYWVIARHETRNTLAEAIGELTVYFHIIKLWFYIVIEFLTNLESTHKTSWTNPHIISTLQNNFVLD